MHPRLRLPPTHSPKQALLLISLLAAATTLITIHLINQPKPTSPTPDHQSLQITQATKQSIQDHLGPPSQTYQADPYLVLSYPSPDSDYTFDLFFLQNDRLVMKELNTSPNQNPTTREHIHSQYGLPDHHYYLPPDLYGQSYVHLYPSRGLAIYLNQSNLVYKTQTFAPTTPDHFLQTWGQDLLLTQPTPTPEDAHEH